MHSTMNLAQFSSNTDNRAHIILVHIISYKSLFSVFISYFVYVLLQNIKFALRRYQHTKLTVSHMCQYASVIFMTSFCTSTSHPIPGCDVNFTTM